MFEDADTWTDFGGWSYDESSSPWNDAGELVIGDPFGDTANWELQDTPYTCAVVSQQMILRDFGLDIPESDLVYRATTNGWLTEEGTHPLDMGNLLEHYGVSTHADFGGGVESLVYELSHGHKVIAAVDSGELWGTDYFFSDWIEPEGADHAVVISGINLSDPNNPMVVLNDPGDASGAGKQYPMHQFLDAWQDSGQMYVATDAAPPDLADHTIFGIGFDAESQRYLNDEFWGGVVAPFSESETADEDFLRNPEVAPTSPWEDLSNEQRNHLFLTI